MVAETFDFQHLQDLLVDATRKTFQSVQQRHRDETLYSFALYTSGGLDYVAPTASTEEGLTYIAQKYIAEGYDHSYSLEEQRMVLRWSPADSPFHLEGSENFTAIDSVLETASAITDALYEETNSWDAAEAFDRRIEETFIAALQELDREGLFGQGAQRETITINLLKGDQSDQSRIQNAQKLNPSAVWQRLAQELEAQAALWRR